MASLSDTFRIADADSCQQAIRAGGYMALISAGLSAIFGILGFFTSSQDSTVSYLLDPWILVDVALILVLATFIFRKSRVAATLLVVYFVYSKITMWMDVGEARGALLSVIFLAAYANAMRGTYLWHSKYRDLAAQSRPAQ